MEEEKKPLEEAVEEIKETEETESIESHRKKQEAQQACQRNRNWVRACIFDRYAYGERPQELYTNCADCGNHWDGCIRAGLL